MASDHSKAQPWRELYSKLDIPVPGEIGSIVDEGEALQDGRYLSKRWFSLERGQVGKEKVEALAARVTEVFHGNPWYDIKYQATRCSSCGNDPCTCSVLEGG